MIDLDFSFEQDPVVCMISNLQPGDSVSGARLLTLMEDEASDDYSDLLEMVSEAGLTLDVSDLPKPALPEEFAPRLKEEEKIASSGMQTGMLDDTDPLKLYLDELAAIPATGDEAILAQEILNGDISARNLLANLGLSRVISISREYTGFGVFLLDLIQEGSLGLWQAICRFQKGNYESYRDMWIRNAMAVSVLLGYRNSGVGQKLRTAMEDYRSMDEQLLSDLGRNPSLEEIADRLHKTPEETRMIQKMIADARLIQQARGTQENAESSPEDEQPVEDTAYFQMRQRILDLLSVLEETDASILSLRFGLDKGLPLSPQETAAKLGLTSDEVIRREAAALEMLRREK